MVLVNNRVGYALFSVVFRCAANITDHLISKLCANGSLNIFYMKLHVSAVTYLEKQFFS